MKLDLVTILEKADKEIFLTKEEMVFLLGLTEPADQEMFFTYARKAREKYFGKKIFMYGFVYFSTFCRNNCAFCFYRSSNDESIRYSKDLNEIIETADRLAQAGIHLIDLTMGEDPEYVGSEEGLAKLLEVVEKVKAKTGLPIMISPGVLDKNILSRLKNAGAEWYACYQETHNRKLFAELRLEQSYDERIECKNSARKLGMLTEEGLLSGVGDTDDDVADSMYAMRELDVDQVRVMSFVPQKGTEMEEWITPERKRELLIIALMRILFPDRLIPASLDVDGIKGLKPRLDAGSNVVTSIIPPFKGFAGVSQNTLDIDDGNRTVDSAIEIIKDCGLTAAELQDYKNWVVNRMKRKV